MEALFFARYIRKNVTLSLSTWFGGVKTSKCVCIIRSKLPTVLLWMSLSCVHAYVRFLLPYQMLFLFWQNVKYWGGEKRGREVEEALNITHTHSHTQIQTHTQTLVRHNKKAYSIQSRYGVNNETWKNTFVSGHVGVTLSDKNTKLKPYTVDEFDWF